MADYLNFNDIAEELGIPIRTVYYLNQIGEGPKCIKVGRTFLVSKSDYASWLKSKEQK
jgi:predicted DNA-binding transcriptional regulator AlpA